MRVMVFLLLICVSLVPQVAQAAAIHDAARNGDVAAVTAALNAGIAVDANEGSGTPLYIAVRRGHFAATKLLLERGANANALSNYWGSALQVAASKSRSDLMVLLLDHGANPESTLNGERALHISAKFGCLACVKALVEAGADVNAVTFGHYGRTPIHLAKFYNYDEMANYLMAHGVVLPKPEPISAKLASADAEKGRIYFERNCAACHYANPGETLNHGPNLWNVVGRDKHSLPGYDYSKAIRALEGTWTYEDLNTWLYGAAVTTPGVLMETPGIADETERANVIAYLRTLSDQPIPLP